MRMIRPQILAALIFAGAAPLNATDQSLNDDYPQVTAAIAAHYMVNEAQLIRGVSTESLGHAEYQESGPLLAVVIAEDVQHFYLYLENCDVCSVLARSKKETGKLETLKQSHHLTHKDLVSELNRYGVKTSILDSTHR